jgi:hypothetical protein
LGANKLPVSREKDNKVVGFIEPIKNMKGVVLYDVDDRPFEVITDMKTTLQNACLMVEKHYEETHSD